MFTNIAYHYFNETRILICYVRRDPAACGAHIAPLSARRPLRGRPPRTPHCRPRALSGSQARRGRSHPPVADFAGHGGRWRPRPSKQSILYFLFPLQPAVLQVGVTTHACRKAFKPMAHFQVIHQTWGTNPRTLYPESRCTAACVV